MGVNINFPSPIIFLFSFSVLLVLRWPNMFLPFPPCFRLLRSPNMFLLFFLRSCVLLRRPNLFPLQIFSFLSSSLFLSSKYFPPFPYSKSFTGFAPLCSCHRYHFSGNNFTVKSNFPRNPTGQEVPGKPKGSHNGSFSLSKQLNNLCCFLFLSKNTYHLILLQSLQSPAVYSLLSPRKGTWENVFMVERRWK